MSDPALDAFRRLLREGAAGGQAKVDALLALAQRTVYLATWTEDGDEHRTLVNGNGQSALPVFTSRDELHRAAAHFGWAEQGVDPPVRELGARQALRYVLSHDLDYLVVDIAAMWRLEASTAEIEPLLEGREEPTGPFAGVGRLSSSVMRAVRPTPPAGSLPAAGFRARPSSQPAAPADEPDTEPDHERLPSPAPASAPPSSAPPPSRPSGISPAPRTPSFLPDGRSLGPAPAPPGDALIDACFQILKDYPEVEWASWCATTPAEGGEPTPAIALRVDTAFRKRLPDIVAALEEAARSSGLSAVDVLMLDAPDLLRAAKAEGLAFYPWRPR